MRSYALHLLQHIGGNVSQARLKCIAKCDAILDKLCPEVLTASQAGQMWDRLVPACLHKGF